MVATFMNSGSVLSIGIFFSLMIIGLSGTLHDSLLTNLTSHGVPHADAARAAGLPPVATLFAAFLGYNPVKTLLGAHGLHGLSAAQQHVVLSKGFFPQIISGPFSHALGAAFIFGLASMLIAAFASAIPAKGQPWIGTGRRRGSGVPAEPESPSGRIEPVPATGELQVARGQQTPQR
jgi:hypothetical protein